MLNRRDMIGSLACASLLPASTACAGQRGTDFTPEQFGAVGNGRADDYPALVRLAAEVSRAGAGIVRFGAGKTYRIDRFLSTRTPSQSGVGHIDFRGCNGLTIDLNGSTIDVKGDFHRSGDVRGSHSSAHAVVPLNLEACSDVIVRGGTLNGNAGLTSADRGVAEGPGHGILIMGCSRVRLEGLHVHHFTADGVYIRGRSGRVSRDIRLTNVRLTNNARQGLTNSGAVGVVATDCAFSETGRTGGDYSRAPGAGVDIEPALQYDLPSDFRAERCRFDNNRGAPVVAGNPATAALVELIDCSGTGSPWSRMILTCAQARIRGGDWHNIQIAPGYGAHRKFGTDVNLEVSGGVWSGDNPGWAPVFDLSRQQPNTWIHHNRFLLRSPQPFRQTYLFRCANPNHRFEDNEVFVAGTGHDGEGDDLVGQFAGATVRRNHWSTDLRDMVVRRAAQPIEGGPDSAAGRRLAIRRARSSHSEAIS
jgi:hypothetical protein